MTPRKAVSLTDVGTFFLVACLISTLHYAEVWDAMDNHEKLQQVKQKKQEAKQRNYESAAALIVKYEARSRRHTEAEARSENIASTTRHSVLHDTDGMTGEGCESAFITVFATALLDQMAVHLEVKEAARLTQLCRAMRHMEMKPITFVVAPVHVNIHIAQLYRADLLRNVIIDSGTPLQQLHLCMAAGGSVESVMLDRCVASRLEELVTGVLAAPTSTGLTSLSISPIIGTWLSPASSLGPILMQLQAGTWPNLTCLRISYLHRVDWPKIICAITDPSRTTKLQELYLGQRDAERKYSQQDEDLRPWVPPLLAALSRGAFAHLHTLGICFPLECSSGRSVLEVLSQGINTANLPSLRHLHIMLPLTEPPEGALRKWMPAWRIMWRRLNASILKCVQIGDVEEPLKGRMPGSQTMVMPALHGFLEDVSKRPYPRLQELYINARVSAWDCEKFHRLLSSHDASSKDMPQLLTTAIGRVHMPVLRKLALLEGVFEEDKVLEAINTEVMRHCPSVADLMRSAGRSLFGSVTMSMELACNPRLRRYMVKGANHHKHRPPQIANVPDLHIEQLKHLTALSLSTVPLGCLLLEALASQCRRTPNIRIQELDLSAVIASEESVMCVLSFFAMLRESVMPHLRIFCLGTYVLKTARQDEAAVLDALQSALDAARVTNTSIDGVQRQWSCYLHNIG